MAEKKFRRLDAYSGTLTVEQTAEGIEAALQNARLLVADAELLLESGRWPRAASLSVLSIEESGKIALLRSLLLTDSPEERKKLWRDYRSHTKKNVMGGFFDHVTQSPHIEDFRGLFDDYSMAAVTIHRSWTHSNKLVFIRTAWAKRTGVSQ